MIYKLRWYFEVWMVVCDYFFKKNALTFVHKVLWKFYVVCGQHLIQKWDFSCGSKLMAILSPVIYYKRLAAARVFVWHLLNRSSVVIMFRCWLSVWAVLLPTNEVRFATHGLKSRVVAVNDSLALQIANYYFAISSWNYLLFLSFRRLWAILRQVLSFYSRRVSR